MKRAPLLKNAPNVNSDTLKAFELARSIISTPGMNAAVRAAAEASKVADQFSAIAAMAGNEQVKSLVKFINSNPGIAAAARAHQKVSALESAAAHEPAAPAIREVRSRLANIAPGNQITLAVCGRDVTFTLRVIAAEKVKKATMVWAGNERDQELLTERALDDLTPSFLTGGQQNPAFGRDVSGIVEVADGSRRRMAAITTGADYLVLVGDLDDEQMAHLSQIGNDYRPTSAYERGRRYARRLENDFDGNLSALAEAEGVDRKIIRRCINTAQLPREIVALFSNPSELSARAGEKLAKAFAANEDAMYSFAGHLATRQKNGEEFDTDQLLKMLFDITPKPTKPAVKTRQFGQNCSVQYKGGDVAVNLKDAPEELIQRLERLLAEYQAEDN